MTIVDYSNFELLTDKDYYSSYGEYMSVSLLKKFADDPLGFDEYMEDRKNNEKPSDALVVGQAAHALILEGDDEFARYRICDALNEKTGKSYGRNTKAWDAALERQNIHPWWALSREQFNQCRLMYQAVRDNYEAVKAIDDCDCIEWALRGSLAGIKFQGKLDACNRAGRIVDLKTMRAGSTGREQIEKFNYLWQAYCYISLYSKAFEMSPDDVSFEFVFVTKEDQPKVEVIKVDQREASYWEAEVAVKVAIDALKLSEQKKDRRAALFLLGDLKWKS